MKKFKAHLEQKGIQGDVISHIEQLYDMQMRGRYTDALVFSDFIDPETLHIAQTVLDGSPKLQSFGGYEDAEYRQVCMTDSDVDVDAYPIALIEISYREKFGALSHRDVLGALMSMGLSRQKFGDIFVDSGTAYVFVGEDMADYVCQQLSKIKRQGVRTRIVPIAQFKMPDKGLVDTAFTAASLRLDVIVAAAFKLSRAQAVSSIKAGQVKCNYSVETSVNRMLEAGDLLSVRKKGRFYLDDVGGKSKKGKIKISGRKTP